MDSGQIAGRMRAARLAKGLTQQELADAARAGLMQISRYENGHVVPTVDTLIAIASVLDVSLDYLVAGTDDPRGVVSGLTPFEQRLVTGARRRNVTALLHEIAAMSNEIDQSPVAGAEKRALDQNLEGGG